jgi:hypothetical protein
MKDFTLDDISKVQPRERFENLRQLRKNRGNPTRNDKLQKYVDTNECQKNDEVVQRGYNVRNNHTFSFNVPAECSVCEDNDRGE